VKAATASNNTFIASAAGYTTTLDSFYNIATTTQTNTLGAVSNVSNIDDAAELGQLHNAEHAPANGDRHAGTGKPFKPGHTLALSKFMRDK